MALTTLDPTTALIIIDLQDGIVALPTVHPAHGIVERAAALADAFRRHALPVVLVNVTAGAPGRTDSGGGAQRPRPVGWSNLVPGLNQQPDDLTVTKHAWGAFHDTGLSDQLAKRGVTQVVIAGVATSIGVESTARSAFELGFNVTLATDAMTDMDPESHANSINRIFPRLGETGTTEEIIGLLDRTRS